MSALKGGCLFAIRLSQRGSYQFPSLSNCVVPLVEVPRRTLSLIEKDFFPGRPGSFSRAESEASSLFWVLDIQEGCPCPEASSVVFPKTCLRL